MSSFIMADCWCGCFVVFLPCSSHLSQAVYAIWYYIFFYIKSLDVNIGQNEVCGCRSKPPLTVPVVESLYR